MTNFPSMLREYRIDAALSQNALARRAGIDPAYVNQIEKGKHGAPSRRVVLCLAQALDLDDAYADRLLYSAGLAPSRDYQALYEGETVRSIHIQALYERATARLSRIQALVDGSPDEPPLARWAS